MKPVRASTKPEPIDSNAWKAQVVRAAATPPTKRTALQRRVLAEAEARWASEKRGGDA